MASVPASSYLASRASTNRVRMTAGESMDDPLSAIAAASSAAGGGGQTETPYDAALDPALAPSSTRSLASIRFSESTRSIHLAGMSVCFIESLQRILGLNFGANHLFLQMAMCLAVRRPICFVSGSTLISAVPTMPSSAPCGWLTLATRSGQSNYSTLCWTRCLRRRRTRRSS